MECKQGGNNFSDLTKKGDKAMAIQFNPNALNAFSNVNFGADDAIANLGENNSSRNSS